MYADKFGSKIELIDSDFDTVDQGKSLVQAVGFVADEAVKRVFGFVADDRYAPFDIDLPKEFLEVKSTNKWLGSRWNVFVSSREFAHATQQWTQNKKDTCYLFFDCRQGEVSTHNMKSIKFVGGVRFSEIEKDWWENSSYGGKQFSQSLLKRV